MLGVVEHEQHAVLADVLGEALDGFLVGRGGDAEGREHGLRHGPITPQWRQLDEPHAVGMAVEGGRRDLDGEARLADAADAGRA